MCRHEDSRDVQPDDEHCDAIQELKIAMSLFAEIQRNLQADSRVKCSFNCPPWFNGQIDGQIFVGMVLEDPTNEPCRADLEHLERLRMVGFRARVIRSWRDVQSCLLCEPTRVYLNLS